MDIVFDYNELKSAEINKEILPIDSIIVNPPFSCIDYYNTNRKFVNGMILAIVIILFGSLLGFTVLLKNNLKIKTQTENQSRIYASTDVLTGIMNRRIGLKKLNEEVDKLDDNTTLSISYLDIDHLKFINDEFGHREGDFVIKKIVEIISETVAENGSVCRSEGDEFLLVFPDNSHYDVLMIMNRLNHYISEYNDLKKHEYILSFSYGIVEYNPVNHKNIEELIDQADK